MALATVSENTCEASFTFILPQPCTSRCLSVKRYANFKSPESIFKRVCKIDLPTYFEFGSIKPLKKINIYYFILLNFLFISQYSTCQIGDSWLISKDEAHLQKHVFSWK